MAELLAFILTLLVVYKFNLYIKEPKGDDWYAILFVYLWVMYLPIVAVIYLVLTAIGL